MSGINLGTYILSTPNPKIQPKRHGTMHNNRDLFMEMAMGVDVMDMRRETEIRTELES